MQSECHSDYWQSKLHTAIWSCLKAGDLSLPGPWCPAHSGVSGWRCQSSAAAVAERRLWADRPPPCRRSLTEAVRRGWKEGRKEGMRSPTEKWLSRGWPTALVGRESSFRFSSHSWSCFFTLFMSDSCGVKHFRLVPRLLRMVLACRRTSSTYRVIQCVDPGWPRCQTGWLKLLLR